MIQLTLSSPYSGMLKSARELIRRQAPPHFYVQLSENDVRVERGAGLGALIERHPVVLRERLCDVAWRAEREPRACGQRQFRLREVSKDLAGAPLAGRIASLEVIVAPALDDGADADRRLAKRF